MASRRKTALRKVNPKRQAKRRALYRKKLAAYTRSLCHRYVEERAKGRCEGRIWWEPTQTELRCGATKYNTSRSFTHHHKTYARFGGTELPEDIEYLCWTCNERAEAKHPTRRRDWK